MTVAFQSIFNNKLYIFLNFLFDMQITENEPLVNIMCLITLNNLVEQTWAQGYKTFFILNSVEHEILNAHKYKNIKKFSFFQAQISGEDYFSCS